MERLKGIRNRLIIALLLMIGGVLFFSFYSLLHIQEIDTLLGMYDADQITLAEMTGLIRDRMAILSRVAFLFLFIIITLYSSIVIGVIFEVSFSFKAILQGIKEISVGNLQHRIFLRADNEFGTVVRFFNQAIDQIEKSRQEIERVNKSLEEKVRQRTADLEDLNSGLEDKIQKRTTELEDLKISLETQVEERTKQLQKNLEEMDKFKELTIDRELKMVELKKELEKMRAEVKPADIKS